MSRQRATRDEIFSRMAACMGSSALVELHQAIADLEAERYESADKTIAKLDAQLGGGFGVYVYFKNLPRGSSDERSFRVKRPFYYIHGHLRSRDPFRWGRTIVRDIGLHIEVVVKEFAEAQLPRRARRQLRGKPLGSMLSNQEFQMRAPVDVVKQLMWFNNHTYVQSKHGHKENTGAVAEDDPDSRLFELDEALAIYFIARDAALKLMRAGGIQPEQL